MHFSERDVFFLVACTFGFRSITLDGMHQFHFNFTEGSSINKYRSSLKKGVSLKILTEFWSFFDIDFG